MARKSVIPLIDESLERIPKLRRQGLTLEQISKAIGIGYKSLQKYSKTYEPLIQALKKGREELIEDLEDTLFKKALGLCTTKTTKKYIEKTPSGKDKQKIEEVTAQLPPDTACLIYALKNLSPERWKDNPEFNFTELENRLKDMKSFSERAKELKTIDVKEENPLE